MSVGLLTAEWTKIRSVRSTLWSLLAFMVVAIGFSALIIIVISNTWNSPGNHPNHVRLLEDPTAVLFGAGFGLGQLAICVLGVIVMSSEYSTGAIRASLLAVPRRLPMLAAKAIVFALLDLVVSAITVFAVFFITTAIIRSHVSITLSQPGIARACIGGILYLTVLGLFSLAIGGLIRHTAGAISAVIALVLVVPPLVSLIPGTIANHIHGYLPTSPASWSRRAASRPGTCSRRGRDSGSSASGRRCCWPRAAGCWSAGTPSDGAASSTARVLRRRAGPGRCSRPSAPRSRRCSRATTTA